MDVQESKITEIFSLANGWIKAKLSVMVSLWTAILIVEYVDLLLVETVIVHKQLEGW